MWLFFFFLQHALQPAPIINSDDICLTTANANYTYGKPTNVLLFTVGAILKLKEQPCLNFCHEQTTQGLLQDRWRAFLPIDREAHKIHAARVHVFSDASEMCKNKTDRFLEDRSVSQNLYFKTDNRIHLVCSPR